MKIKPALLAAVLVIAITSAGAIGQEQTSTPAEAPTVRQMPPGPSTDMAPLCARMNEHAHYYPDHARDRGIEGQAMLECALDSSNRPETCWLLSETPQNESFGAAGLKLICYVRAHPLRDVSRAFHVDGDARPHLQMPMTFRLSGG